MSETNYRQLCNYVNCEITCKLHTYDYKDYPTCKYLIINISNYLNSAYIALMKELENNLKNSDIDIVPDYNNKLLHIYINDF